METTVDVECAPLETTLAVPGELAAYTLLRRIGSGAATDVYLAEHQNSDSRVAIKVMRTDADAVEVQRRHRIDLRVGLLPWEFDVARCFSHRNVIRVIEQGSSGGLDYLAMELFDAPTLQDVLAKREHARLLPQFAQFAEQCAAALTHVHDAGWLHADIKPGNFLLNAAGLVKLIDFDLARPIRNGAAFNRPRWVSGTLAYMASEQKHRRQLDERADVYSLGVVLYELLTGQLPYVERRTMTFRELRETPVIPLVRRFNPAVTEELADLLARMLSSDRAARPRTMHAFLDEFRMIRLFESDDRPVPAGDR